MVKAVGIIVFAIGLGMWTIYLLTGQFEATTPHTLLLVMIIGTFIAAALRDREDYDE